jgi:hypothetical protein
MGKESNNQIVLLVLGIVFIVLILLAAFSQSYLTNRVSLSPGEFSQYSSARGEGCGIKEKEEGDVWPPYTSEGNIDSSGGDEGDPEENWNAKFTLKEDTNFCNLDVCPTGERCSRTTCKCEEIEEIECPEDTEERDYECQKGSLSGSDPALNLNSRENTFYVAINCEKGWKRLYPQEEVPIYPGLTFLGNTKRCDPTGAGEEGICCYREIPKETSMLPPDPSIQPPVAQATPTPLVDGEETSCTCAINCQDIPVVVGGEPFVSTGPCPNDPNMVCCGSLEESQQPSYLV